MVMNQNLAKVGSDIVNHKSTYVSLLGKKEQKKS